MEWRNRLTERRIGLLMSLVLTASVMGCARTDSAETTKQTETYTTAQESQTEEVTTSTALELMNFYNSGVAENIIDDKYRTFYEVFLYSYYDSDGDGIGDINGLIEKLDYINDGDSKTSTDLGATGIWLMPIMPSPSYHKYDVTDYYAIDEQYGSLEDFDRLLSECHSRGINVIIDLVLNHTSSEHPWFTTACDYLRTLGEDEEPDLTVCPYVDYYDFTRSPSGGSMYVVTGTNWYYRGEFTYTMPDLNLDSAEVRSNISDIASFWLDRGVDGFRLDAVLYFYESDTTQNVEFLTWFNDLCKSSNPDTYIVGECWTDASTYNQYYASGIDSLFNFAYSGAEGAIVKSVKQSGKYKTALGVGQDWVNIQNTLSEYPTAIDAPFFTNHDMGRAAGYFYSPGNSEYWVKTGWALNLLMRGNAFIYYGEEIGMSGSGADENKRAPMLWSEDSSSAGMCLGPSGYSAKHNYPSVAIQSEDGNSILNYIRQVIKLRNAYPSIARGDMEVIEANSGDDILVLKRTYADETIYMVFNLSKEASSLDLSGCAWYSGASTIGGVLLTGTEDISIEDSVLSLPRETIVIFK